MFLNCVVVDDSANQRISTLKLIENNASLNLIKDFNTIIEAKKYINTHKVDLLFIAIEMLIHKRVGFIDFINSKSQVIFISNKIEYAIKAFDYCAVDYLKTPITKERFNIAVEKAITTNSYKTASNTNEDDYIFVKSNLKNQKVYIKDIKWIEALGDYVKVVTEDNSLVVLSTMKAFENSLPQHLFLRIHKSYIVCLEKINRFDGKNVEIGTFKIPLSRNKKTQLSDVLNNRPKTIYIN